MGLQMRKTNRLDMTAADEGKMKFHFDENGKPVKIDEQGNVTEMVDLPKEYLFVFNKLEGILQTLGLLEIGKTYSLASVAAGDDFSNVADVIYGSINTPGCIFVATETTPTSWANGSELFSDLITGRVLNNNTSFSFSINVSYSTSGVGFFEKIVIQENSAFTEFSYFAEMKAGQMSNLSRISVNELNFDIGSRASNSCFFRYLEY